MMKYMILCALCIGATVAQSPQAFAADVWIYNDANINGILAGRMFYDYSNKSQRIDYTLGPSEIIDFDRGFRYFGCSSECEADIWYHPLPEFFRDSEESFSHTPFKLFIHFLKDNPTGERITIDGRTCQGYSKSGAGIGVTTIWIDDSNDSLPCRAQFANGKTIDFTNFGDLTPVFNDYTSWSCPQPLCNRKMDVMWLIDESNSAVGTPFADQKIFIESVANSSRFSLEHVRMGAILVAREARLSVGLTEDKESFLNTLRNETALGGFACLSCGFALAHQHFNENSRQNTTKVIIFMSDGNNIGVATIRSTVDAAKADGIIIFGVGINTTAMDEADLNYYASSIEGVRTAWFFTVSDDWSPLLTVLDEVTVNSCLAPPGNPCGSECHGFCSCGFTCMCPDICDDNSNCTSDTCVEGQGCVYENICETITTVTIETTATTGITGTTESTGAVTTSVTTSSNTTEAGTTSSPIATTGIRTLEDETASSSFWDFLKDTLIIAILGSVALFVILSIIVVVLIVKICKHKTKIEYYGMEMMAPVFTAVYDTHTFEEIERNLTKMRMNMIDSSQVSIVSQLGEGNFGVVYKGMWNATPVALKKLKDSTQMKAFVTEATILASVNHPNIVRLLGIMKDSEDSCFYIVTEFIAKGSLTSVLANPEESSKLTQSVLLDMAEQVASAMQYLEAEKIVHRDVSARNLLVTIDVGKYVVKVSDLGLGRSSDYYDDSKQSSAQMPIRWCAPEVLKHRQYSHKSDVWAFGVTLWEMQSFGVLPYFQYSNTEVVELVVRGDRLIKPNSCPDELYNLMLSCWDAEPAKRPSFAEIVKNLREIAINYKDFESIESEVAHQTPFDTQYMLSPVN